MYDFLYFLFPNWKSFKQSQSGGRFRWIAEGSSCRPSVQKPTSVPDPSSLVSHDEFNERLVGKVWLGHCPLGISGSDAPVVAHLSSTTEPQRHTEKHTGIWLSGQLGAMQMETNTGRGTKEGTTTGNQTTCIQEWVREKGNKEAQYRIRRSLHGWLRCIV